MRNLVFSGLALATLLAAGCAPSLSPASVAAPGDGRPYVVELRDLSGAEALGALGFTLELGQADRAVMALPSETAILSIAVKSDRLAAPVVAQIDRNQFAGGKAEIRIDKLLPGNYDVEAAALDGTGGTLASGSAQATVAAGKTSSVAIRMSLRRATGGLAVSIDSVEAPPETPVVTILAGDPPFEGRWRNEDPATGGITRAELRKGSQGYGVHMWGACSPTDCDWGELTGAQESNGVLALRWDFGFAVDTQTVRVLEDGRLEVKSHTAFKDGSGRADYDAVYRFVRDVEKVAS